ncbi:hypothetical protein B0T16DRAFT_393912 [Cercophora newfieldiana]|uniref:Uncharacterized protein n=1 Tax=Cercophora newfieldiana TaxID=92897 RepID=A0AA39XX09_9PEZI|nr:hypothetical protein B0T16DRAFT_393912 [Cercophora newfieldiana]
MDSSDAKQGVDAASKATAASEIGRLACPFFRAFPPTDRVPSISKTCLNGFAMRHLKQHLKNHHKCNIHVEDDSASACGCGSQLHLTPEQLEIVEKPDRRRKDESPCQQWVRFFEDLFPGREVPPPMLPTTEHLKAVARDPPLGLIEELDTRFRGIEPGDAGKYGARSRAEVFLRQFEVYVDVVSAWGIRRPSAGVEIAERRAEMDPDTTLVEEPATAESPSQLHFNNAAWDRQW